MALIRPNDVRYQISGNDEEHIDADITAVETGDAGVEEYDGEDCNGAKTVDIRSIFVRVRLRYGRRYNQCRSQTVECTRESHAQALACTPDAIVGRL